MPPPAPPKPAPPRPPPPRAPAPARPAGAPAHAVAPPAPPARPPTQPPPRPPSPRATPQIARLSDGGPPTRPTSTAPPSLDWEDGPSTHRRPAFSNDPYAAALPPVALPPAAPPPAALPPAAPPPAALPPAAPPPAALPPPKAPRRGLPSLRQGDVIAGRYRIEKILGQGGQGSVYEVRHVHTDERLALKALNPMAGKSQQAIERFRVEARAPIKIGGENVVRVTDADVLAELGQTPIVVMEYLEGRDLGSELARKGALPAGQVCLYLSQVARALDRAHQAGITHRDLKPANLFLTKKEDGSPLVKILDFGIAKVSDGDASEGAVFGTPWYMAPEQASGRHALVGPRTDLWSLGLIAFRLLTGRNYWRSEELGPLVQEILHQPMPPPSTLAPHLGPRFDEWFQRACNRDPAARFATAGEEIAALMTSLGVSSAAQGTGDLSFSRMVLGMSGEIVHPSMSQSIPIPGAGVSQPLPLGASQPLVHGVPHAQAQAAPAPAAPEPQLPTAQQAAPGASTGMAVALGLGIAAVVAVGAFALYLALASRAAPAAQAAAAVSAPVASVAPPPPAETSAPAPPQAPPPPPTADATASAAPSASAPAATALASASAPRAPVLGATGGVKPPAPKNSVAPKVDNIKF